MLIKFAAVIMLSLLLAGCGSGSSHEPKMTMMPGPSDPDEMVLVIERVGSVTGKSGIAGAEEDAIAEAITELRLEDWGYWAHTDGETLFHITMDGDPEYFLYLCSLRAAPQTATCGYTSMTVSGEPSGTNPVGGSAVWEGHARRAAVCPG